MNFFVLPHRVQYMLRSNATAEALRSSEAKLDNAQRIAKLGHWEWCVQSDDISFSGGFIRTMQIASGCNRMSWHSFMERVAEADRTALSEAVTHAIERGGPWSSEFTTQPILDCGPRTIRLEAEPLIDQDGNCTHMLGTVQDITERLNAQEQIHNLAYYDIVTGLPNRARLLKSLEEVLDRASRERTRFAVLFLDLDHFKQVNDTLGHDAGDALLQQVAERINNVLRESDVLTKSDDDSGDHTVARLGGDEFVVLLGSIRRPEDSARVAQRIAATIREPFRLGESEVRISTTIGISVYPADGKNSDSLLKHADVAMYHAKERGRDGYQFYSRGIHDLALDRLTLEKDLKQAITNNALTLVFQPKVNLATGQVSGCETLVRWNHPERGDISPVEFIPLAEETGLIVPLGQWVLKAACEQMQQWHAKGEAKFSVSVNCSAVQFTRGNMEREIEAALLSSGLDAAYLEIELTESLLMQDPADKLKIDRQFITDLASDAGDKAIVAAITSLSHDLGLTVVAEGVETGEQLDVLRRLECDEAQGYLFGKPLTADELIRLMVGAACRALPATGEYMNDESPLSDVGACVFDAYGTLLDVHSAVRRHADRIGPRHAELSAEWRRRQLEYTWLHSLMREHRDFEQLTKEALAVSLAALNLDQSLSTDLMLAYRELDAFPEVGRVLSVLGRAGMQRAILSTGRMPSWCAC